MRGRIIYPLDDRNLLWEILKNQETLLAHLMGAREGVAERLERTRHILKHRAEVVEVEGSF